MAAEKKANILRRRMRIWNRISADEEKRLEYEAKRACDRRLTSIFYRFKRTGLREGLKEGLKNRPTGGAT